MEKHGMEWVKRRWGADLYLSCMGSMASAVVAGLICMDSIDVGGRLCYACCALLHACVPVSPPPPRTMMWMGGSLVTACLPFFVCRKTSYKPRW
jgi:hypothetical protein